jgi:hypothetical protein
MLVMRLADVAAALAGKITVVPGIEDVRGAVLGQTAEERLEPNESLGDTWASGNLLPVDDADNNKAHPGVVKEFFLSFLWGVRKSGGFFC